MTDAARAPRDKRQRPIYKTPAGERAVMALYDRVLAEWPDSTESIGLQTRHAATHVLAQGPENAPPLVLLHGAGSNALAWGADVPEFAKRFRVYAIDTPGEPGRSARIRISWKDEEIVEWLDDVLEGLSVSRPPTLVGISQGGYIALRYATAQPENVRALVLLNPGGVTAPRPSFLLRALACSLMGKRGADALARLVMGDTEVHPVAMEFMNVIYSNFRSRVDPQPLVSDDALRRLTMPVLLMAGAKDALFDGAKTAARVESLVPQAQVQLVAGAGHALVGVAAEMLQFLGAGGGSV